MNYKQLAEAVLKEGNRDAILAAEAEAVDIFGGSRVVARDYKLPSSVNGRLFEEYCDKVKYPCLNLGDGWFSIAATYAELQERESKR